jgi:hypothetical protein
MLNHTRGPVVAGPFSSKQGKLMKRMLMTGAVVLALGFGLSWPVTADRNEVKPTVTPLADKLPAPDALKISEGVLEGHKRPNDVLKKAIKAAKADDSDTLKTCFDPYQVKQLDQKSWLEKDGDKQLTYLEAVTRVLKTYPDAGGTELAQNSTGSYAVVTVKNATAFNMVQTDLLRTKDSEDRNWYLSSYMAKDYRIDYNTPDFKAIRDAIHSGETAKLKEYLDDSQTRVLDLVSGVQEGVNGYDLLIKRFQKIVKNAEKSVLLKQASGRGIAYWFHGEKGDTFLVLRFDEKIDWQSGKKSTTVTIDLNNTAQFLQKPEQTFRNWVRNWR